MQRGSTGQPSSVSGPRHGSLEARIADLDERLRRARLENDALRGRLSPSPRVPSAEPATAASLPRAPPQPLPVSTFVPAREPFPLPAASVALMPHSKYQSPKKQRFPSTSPTRRQPSPPSADFVTSPWREVAARTLRTRDEQLAEHSAKQMTSLASVGDEIGALHERLASVHRDITSKEREMEQQAQRKEQLVAQSLREIQEARDQTAELDKTATQLQQQASELSIRKATLTRQLEETRLALSRAQSRSAEMAKEQQRLEGDVRALEASVHEKERARREELERSKAALARQRDRVAMQEEENRQADDRLRHLEAQHTSQEAKWREEEQALEHELESAEQLLVDQTARLKSLQAELSDREAEALEHRRIREAKLAEQAAARTAERESDIAKAKRDAELRAVHLQRDHDEMMCSLRAQLAQLEPQIAAREKSRDESNAALAELSIQLAHLRATCEEKQRLSEKCDEAEAQFKQLQVEHRSLLAESQAQQEKLHAKEREIVNLNEASQKLRQKLEEERKLRDYVNDVAQEVAHLQATHDAEKVLAEQEQEKYQVELDQLHVELVNVKHELEVERATSASEIERLLQQRGAVKREIMQKEENLAHLVADCTTKQQAVAQFQDEKRRIEQEQLARKMAAANAARAALSQLAP